MCVCRVFECCCPWIESVLLTEHGECQLLIMLARAWNGSKWNRRQWNLKPLEISYHAMGALCSYTVSTAVLFLWSCLIVPWTGKETREILSNGLLGKWNEFVSQPSDMIRFPSNRFSELAVMWTTLFLFLTLVLFPSFFWFLAFSVSFSTVLSLCKYVSYFLSCSFVKSFGKKMKMSGRIS